MSFYSENRILPILTACSHKEQVLKNSDIDPVQVNNVTYLHEFDRAIQCPTFGYPTEGAYYRDASSADSVLAIKIPCLALHAQDDPVSTIPRFLSLARMDC